MAAPVKPYVSLLSAIINGGLPTPKRISFDKALRDAVEQHGKYKMPIVRGWTYDVGGIRQGWFTAIRDDAGIKPVKDRWFDTATDAAIAYRRFVLDAASVKLAAVDAKLEALYPRSEAMPEVSCDSGVADMTTVEANQ